MVETITVKYYRCLKVPNGKYESTGTDQLNWKGFTYLKTPYMMVVAFDSNLLLF